MRMAVIGTLPNMILSEEFKRMKFSKINIEKSGSQVAILKGDFVRELIGTLEHDTALSVPCFYVNINFDSTQTNAINELQIFRNTFQRMLFCFWLVKDHSIHSDSIFSIGEKRLSSNRSPVTPTNAKGIYSENHFTRIELMEAEKWFAIDLERTKKEERTEKRIREPITIGNITTFVPKNLPYLNTNRTDRALRFILAARSESFLPAKITFYISALESLLSSSNTELKFQVADRTSRVLASSYEEKIKILKTVDIAYSFRSNYIHGATSNEKSIRKSLKKGPISYENVEELSAELDEILRAIVKRFLTDLNYVNDLVDSKDFTEWMDGLLYK